MSVDKFLKGGYNSNHLLKDLFLFGDVTREKN
jgi:muramoyltetrapeptide carboxypeptidase LdcA involved in peptidoglycan recycling